METLEQHKSRVRRMALTTRNALPAADRARSAMAAGERACTLILSRWVAPHIVSAYWPMRSELDTRPLLAQLADRGMPMALPVVVAPAAPLQFRRYRPGDALVIADFGQSEPAISAEAVLPDLLLVPLAAIDHDGYRIGYGGGFYDRSLAALKTMKPTVSIGFAFDEQCVERVPRGPYDVALDWLITPTRTVNFGHAA